MREKRVWRSGWVFTKSFRNQFIDAYAAARKREQGYFTQSQYVERLVALGLELEAARRRGKAES